MAPDITVSGATHGPRYRTEEVACLVVDRKTNSQIAAGLLLSQDIFRKVDVASRVELARAVERADSDGL